MTKYRNLLDSILKDDELWENKTQQLQDGPLCPNCVKANLPVIKFKATEKTWSYCPKCRQGFLVEKSGAGYIVQYSDKVLHENGNAFWSKSNGGHILLSDMNEVYMVNILKKIDRGGYGMMKDGLDISVWRLMIQDQLNKRKTKK